MNEIDGASAEVYPDFETRRVNTDFRDPVTGEIVTQLTLDPDTAREYAFQLTRCSISLEVKP